MRPLLNMYAIPYLRVKSYSSTIQFYSLHSNNKRTAVRVVLIASAFFTTHHGPPLRPLSSG